MKSTKIVLIVLLISMSLFSCEDNDKTTYWIGRDIYIQNGTNRDIQYDFSTYREGYQNFMYGIGFGNLSPFHKSTILKDWIYFGTPNMILHIHVRILPVVNGDTFQESKEKDYYIKCSELEEKYNTIIIYDDDDTTKW